MNTGRTSTGIRTGGKALIPVHGSFRRAGNRFSTGNRLLRSLAREQFFKDHSVSVTFLGGGRIVGEAVGSLGKHLIGNLILGHVFEVVHPAVSDTITELFLLSPQHFMWEVWVIGGVKGLAHGPFFNLGIRLADVGSLDDHFFLRIQFHGHIHKVGIQKGNARFDAPGTHGLVAAQAIVHVQTADLVHGFVKEFLSVGGLVEVKVSTKNLIGSFSTENHLNPHGLDFTRHEVHGCGSTNGGDIVRFDATNDIANGIGSLFNGVSVRVMDGPQVIGHLFGRQEIRRIGQSNGKGMQFGKGGGSTTNVTSANGRHQR
mmetsp:Transcript_25293/g.52629  ORF Transcript_25293/g.52629 Transcript_25293/m.52629 type:complete len:315 (-) Transcript_25293:1041-1985(-)